MPENPVIDSVTDQEMASAHAALRERVLQRLWEIAYMPPEMTRNSVTGQVKAIAMIIAMEGLIPDRRAGSSDKNSASPARKASIFTPQWRLERQRKAAGLDPDQVQDQDVPADLPSNPDPTPEPNIEAGEVVAAHSARPAEATPSAPQPPASAPVPGMRVPYVPQTNPFARGRY